MKKIFFFWSILCLCPDLIVGQIINNGGVLRIDSTATLHTDTELENSNAGSLQNNGILNIERHLTNDINSQLSGNGQYLLGGNWNNSGSYTAGTSLVNFRGDSSSVVISGNDDFYKIELSKNDANVFLADPMEVRKEIAFINTTKIILGSSNLQLQDSANIINFDADNYMVTNDLGQLKKAGLADVAFTFPIGNNATTYNPVILVQSEQGISDNYGVRCLANVLNMGTTGTPLVSNAVDASWEISEAIPGGSDLLLSFQWEASDELSDFDRSQCGISFYTSSWDNLLRDDLGPASTPAPFTRTIDQVTELGLFAIGDTSFLDYINIDLQAFLQGAYSGTQMNDNLRSDNWIPLEEPYTDLTGFTHVGNGGGETMHIDVLSTTGNDAIVDWVFLELRDKNDADLVLETQSALIQRDGDIVAVDGVSPVRFTGIHSDDFYVAVHHRNHLGVRSSSTLGLSQTLTSYNFTTDASKAFGTEPMANLNGVFALWGGDANGDRKVRYSDLFIPPSTFIPSDALAVFNELGGLPSAQIDGYSLFDLNMDGKVRYSDLFIPPFTFIPSDALFIFNVLGGVPSAQQDQQF